MTQRKAEIYFFVGKNGRFYWHAKAPNGKIVDARTGCGEELFDSIKRAHRPCAACCERGVED